MKIVSIDIITVVVPTIPGRVHSASLGPAGWDQVPKHIIRLNTDEGIYGLGETSRGTPEEAIRQGFNQLSGNLSTMRQLPMLRASPAGMDPEMTSA